MNNVPVFLHIPKNAGTYVFHAMRQLLKGSEQFRPHKIYRLMDAGVCVATVFGSAATESELKCRSTRSPMKCEVECAHFLDTLQRSDIRIFSAIIHSSGFRQLGEIVDQLERGTGRQATRFALLRDPFERARSLYNYLTSPRSRHEVTHINSPTLADYLRSHESEDCWLIRELLRLTNSHIITDDDFNRACDVLDAMTIMPMAQVNEAMDDVFRSCYGVRYDMASIGNRCERNSHDKGGTLDGVDDMTKQVFNLKSRYDRLLYNRYCL